MTSTHLFALGGLLIRNRNFCRLAPLVLVLLAALLRFGYLEAAPRGMQFDHVDAQGYHWIAVNLLERGVFSMNTEAPFREDNIRAPLYPLFVAGWYAIGGPMPEVVVLAQVLVDVLTVGVLFRLGKQVAGRRVGWLAALLYALHPAPWRFCNELLTEILFGLLLTSSVWMFARYLARGRNRDALRCGVLFGAAILCKPNIQFLPLVLVVILLHGVTTGRKQWWQGAALMAGVIALMLAPWMLRNRIIFGEAFYTRTFDDNLAHVSAVATLAEIEGEPVAPWTPRWEELYAQVIAQAAQRYGWASVDEATLSSRERDVRLQQITAVSLDLLRAHPKEFVVSHTRSWLWSFIPQEHKFWYTRLSGQSWDALPTEGDALGRALKALGQGQVVRAGTILLQERLLALPPLALFLWVGWAIGSAAVILLCFVGAARLRPRMLAGFMMATLFYVTFVPGPISQVRFRLPVLPTILLLVAVGAQSLFRSNSDDEQTDRFAVYDEIRERNLKAEPEQVEADVAEALRAARGKK